MSPSTSYRSTSGNGDELGGTRIPVREPWSTPSTMIRCMMAWALTEEAASARAETTDILSGYERELKEWDSVFFTSMLCQVVFWYRARADSRLTIWGVKSKVVYTRNRFGVAKRSLKRLGPLEEHLAWRYSGLHSARVTAKGCVKHQVTSYCLFLENIQSNREALAKNNRRMQKFGKEPPEARYAMFCVSSFEKRKRYYWHRDLCANPPASMAIYDCEIFSKELFI
ncbi:hypothetical protein KCU75_g17, partial [Aureobasidium melanogenum]